MDKAWVTMGREGRLHVATLVLPELVTDGPCDVTGAPLAVLGVRDPLLPSAARIKEVAQQMRLDRLTIAVLKDAAHAINFSHPRETADLIRGFVRGEPLHSSLESVDGRSPVAVLSRV